MLRRLLALFLFAAAMFAPARATAAVVHDGEKYSVDFGAARICFIRPIELRTAEDCEGLTPENVGVPADDGTRTIAMGLVRLEEPGELPRIGLVMVMHVDMAITHEPDDTAARDYAEGATRAIGKELPPGAKMRAATDARIVRAAPVPLIRAVFDADGIAPGSGDELVEHQVHYAGIAEDGMYTVAWLSRRTDARAVEALAEASTPSIRIGAPAASRKELERRIGIVVGIVFALGGVLVAVAVGLLASRKRAPAIHPSFGGAPVHPSHAYAAPPAWHPASVAHRADAASASASDPHAPPAIPWAPPPPPSRPWPDAP